MEPENVCRFLLLDFGHPMNSDTVNTIMNSLENILTLILAVSRAGLTFGISILNSDFAIFESELYFRRNYNSVNKKLRAALTTAMSKGRVTVQEYKYLLSNSIEAILHDFQKYIRDNNLSSQSTNYSIHIGVMTKKTASTLADILRDVTNKLKITLPNMPLVKNYKIIQILNREDNNPSATLDKSTLIDWTCCFDDSNGLDCFFKEWLFNQQQQLRITLSKELNLEVLCDVDDCLVNPSSILDGRFGLVNDVWIRGSGRNSSLGILKPPRELEVINRFPASGFCPTFVFGIPRRLTATRSPTLNWTESEINSKMFHELSRELHEMGEGLLAKSALSFPTGGEEELIGFHLLTSDGKMLLMNDVAPDELHLPTPEDGPNCCQDESAASLVRACFKKIKRYNEYNPKRYTSGIYDYLRNSFLQTGERKTWERHFDPNYKFPGKKQEVKENPKTGPASNASCDKKFGSRVRENQRKRPKTEAEVQLENVHPALLPQNVVDKYRKVHPQALRDLQRTKTT